MEMRMRTPTTSKTKCSLRSAESRIPKIILAPVKAMVEECLKSLDHTFSKMYASMDAVYSSGAPSQGLLLQLLYSIRSERSLIEHIDYNSVRWFVGLNLDEPVWNHSTFSKNRDRLIDSEVAISFLS